MKFILNKEKKINLPKSCKQINVEKEKWKIKNLLQHNGRMREGIEEGEVQNIK